MAMKRLNYFKGELLDKADFDVEQMYHVTMLREHNKNLHKFGIAKGLDVKGDSDGKSVKITSGMAIDAQGRIILVDDDVDQSILDTNEKNIYLTISYQEGLVDPRDDNTGVGFQNTRYEEKPLIKFVKESDFEKNDFDESSNLVLAKVTLKDNKISVIDTSVQSNRKLAGAGQWNDVEGGISYKEGNVGIGTPSPSEKLEVSGTVKADKFLGDGSGLTGIKTGQWTDVTGGVSYNSGNVGIGTASPENADGWTKVVDILGSITTKLSIRTPNIDARVLSHEDGFWGAPAGMIIGTKSAHYLSFGTSATSRMTINKDGNVGIGTPTPSA